MTDIPCHPMTEYEQFTFDLKGFFVIPSVLSEAEIQIVRNHIDNCKRDPKSLPESHRAPTLAAPMYSPHSPIATTTAASTAP